MDAEHQIYVPTLTVKLEEVDITVSGKAFDHEMSFFLLTGNLEFDKLLRKLFPV